MTNMKTAFECSQCGCRHIQMTAWVRWDCDEQRLVIADEDGPLEASYCPDCDSDEATAVTVEYNPE